MLHPEGCFQLPCDESVGSKSTLITWKLFGLSEAALALIVLLLL